MPPNTGARGHSVHILVGMCHGKLKNGGLRSSSSMKMRGSRVDSSMKWGFPELTCRTRLAGCNPGALPDRFTFGLAAVNQPWAATERLEGTEILKMMGSRAAKTVKY